MDRWAWLEEKVYMKAGEKVSPHASGREHGAVNLAPDAAFVLPLNEFLVEAVI